MDARDGRPSVETFREWFSKRREHRKEWTLWVVEREDREILGDPEGSVS